MSESDSLVGQSMTNDQPNRITDLGAGHVRVRASGHPCDCCGGPARYQYGFVQPDGHVKWLTGKFCNSVCRDMHTQTGKPT